MWRLLRQIKTRLKVALGSYYVLHSEKDELGQIELKSALQPIQPFYLLLLRFFFFAFLGLLLAVVVAVAVAVGHGRRRWGTDGGGRRPQVELLERMLVFSPGRRITVDEALAHEFLAEVGVSATPPTPTHAIPRITSLQGASFVACPHQIHQTQPNTI